jgi:glyoxylase-like metal-dependent hydrolase (beta-lactamase superfamily II)
MNKTALSITLLTLTLWFSAPGFSKEVTIQVIPVTDHIYMLKGQGGNIGLFTGADGSFIIDDQFAPLTDKILAAIKSIGGDTPKILLNTHFHGDHTGGNENIGKLGTTIISHHNVRERLQKGSQIKEFGMKAPPAKKVALPTITFSKNMHLHINNETIIATYVPNAHTDGDSFVRFEKANVIHAGDIFFNGFYPFIDGTHGGSLKGMIAAADVILALSDDKTRIIPGHGPLSNRAELQRYRDMLETAYQRLLKLKQQGLSAQQAIDQKPLQDLEDKWGKVMFNSERWIEVIYPAVF